MNPTSSMLPGLADPVHDAQRSFRAVLDALSRPGTVQRFATGAPGLALGGAMAHLLLTLTDEGTPVWWQAADAVLPAWLRFHTGAPLAAGPAQAAFAVVTDPETLPLLEAFAAGSAQAPEFSTTLFIEVPSLTGGPRLTWHGPGIAQPHGVAIAGLPVAFWAQWQANHAGFPQGVDIVFTCGQDTIGLPRTTRVSRLQGV
jgi:alpha-D-ribose 1-methylphosphonate 5-triphosphate synthase subunit PhnH